MKRNFKIKVESETGNVTEFNVTTSGSDEKKNLNDFILEALSISEDKRTIPLIIQCPNGVEVFPSIKMKFENHGSPILGDELEAMVIDWR